VAWAHHAATRLQAMARKFLVRSRVLRSVGAMAARYTTKLRDRIAHEFARIERAMEVVAHTVAALGASEVQVRQMLIASILEYEAGGVHTSVLYEGGHLHSPHAAGVRERLHQWLKRKGGRKEQKERQRRRRQAKSTAEAALEAQARAAAIAEADIGTGGGGCPPESWIGVQDGWSDDDPYLVHRAHPTPENGSMEGGATLLREMDDSDCSWSHGDPLDLRGRQWYSADGGYNSYGEWEPYPGFHGGYKFYLD
jgi:hypothetical protein